MILAGVETDTGLRQGASHRGVTCNRLGFIIMVGEYHVCAQYACESGYFDGSSPMQRDDAPLLCG
jgi:hypothetical protein